MPFNTAPNLTLSEDAKLMLRAPLPRPRPVTGTLSHLAERYFQQVDRASKKVCQGEPTKFEEFQTVKNQAQEIFHEIAKEAYGFGYSPHDLQEAILSVAQSHHVSEPASCSQS